MIYILSGIVILFAIIFFVSYRQFGKTPSGERLERIKESPNFIDGEFRNIESTPAFAHGYSVTDIALKHFSTKRGELGPASPIPSKKINLLEVALDNNILVWFGHSSYYMQIYGNRFLVDPVFSGKVSPLPGSHKSYDGTDVYDVEDMPDIDFLILTHDHYDHLDYKTINRLKTKVNTVICGLGVGEHFEYWGYSKDKIIEKDWHETISIADGVTIHTETARHFSGRSLSRNKTLWMSYVLETPVLKIFIGGDGGYGEHFKEIGRRHGGFDLAILENGQYNEIWRRMHLFPEEVLKAARDLSAKRLLPVHSAKFTLAFHHWDEPLSRLSEINSNSEYNVPLVTPLIGELVNLDDINQQFSKWWVNIL